MKVLTIRPEVVVVDLPATAEDPFDQWVVEATVDLFGRLRDRVHGDEPPDRLVVAVVEPDHCGPADRPALDAAVAAVRGGVLSLAVEIPAVRWAIVLLRKAQADGLEAVLAYLDGADAAYVTAATLDLRGGVA
ncbi:hypothetical protein KZZ52_45030 [Dactylosporangium sp. AC04546]|uniref:hypothetical protein n=1 Tax=Dactylosporangium sp. AC04546 TaxID=2862460 RepID=UPI001EE0EC2C|nr:hypothetical protein [Dactylosporangium sp. AC04546]WVK81082.1 hypothetical protein KZZ52_45030 [Dactylosporangium sp. AC04546]